MALGGLPTVEETVKDPIKTSVFFDVYGLCSVGVNIFVLISGWFGIRLKLRSLAKLVFQVLFFSLLVFVILVFSDREKYLNLKTFSYVFLLPPPQLWFVKAYVVLMLFSPILNSFVENVSKKQLVYTVLGYYLFHTIYGWLFLDSTPWIDGGYSPLSFFGLYLIARYLRLYPQSWYRWGFVKLVGLFFLMIVSLSFISTTVTYHGHPVAGRLYAYSSPFMICGAVMLLIAFTQINIQSKFINWVSVSSFAVYLTHGNEIVLRGYYAPFIGKIYNNYDWQVAVLLVLLFMLMIFCLSIILDKFRAGLWNFFSVHS